MIQNHRKIALNNFAESIVASYSFDNITQLVEILKSEEIELYVDHYDDAFDGMLVYDGELFHIHLNIDRGNDPDSPRGRFSLAHELAHFFIEEHRIPLMKGDAEVHGSLHDFRHNDEIENEADYFASCLLMPRDTFRSAIKEKKFSLTTIINLSKTFKTSILSTALRFVEIGTHEIFIVVSEKNIIKWTAKSHDFPNWSWRFKIGQAVPPLTVAGEFFTKLDSKFTNPQDVEPESWFYPGWKMKNQMHEQCYYSESYNYVLSIIWFA